MNAAPREPFRISVRLFELGQGVATPGALEATTHAQRAKEPPGYLELVAHRACLSHYVKYVSPFN